MAATASDKTRFFLEQSVPELQEYSRKKIFTSTEIAAIAKKRSDFEHLINLPGASTPSDYARYATYEVNLDQLRKKRCKRLGVKSTNAAFSSGPRKVCFILERGVRRFQGDLGLWMQYFEFCKAQKSNKKLVQALTQCLRFHPMRWEIWVWAAKFFVETQADMTTARSYLQRGLRFCKSERRIWLEYAKLEMTYVAKIAARKTILGLDTAATTSTDDPTANDQDADLIALPSITAEDLDLESSKEAMTDTVSQAALEKLNGGSVLDGAIPLKIAETAMSNFNHDPGLAQDFVDLFAQFTEVQCTKTLLEKTVDSLRENRPDSQTDAPALAYCEARLNLFGVDPLTAEFPLALGKALTCLACPPDQPAAVEAQYAARSLAVIGPYLSSVDAMDPAVAGVVRISSQRSAAKLAVSDVKNTSWLSFLEQRLPSYRAILNQSVVIAAND